jgi:hypothetical protein
MPTAGIGAHALKAIAHAARIARSSSIGTVTLAAPTGRAEAQSWQQRPAPKARCREGLDSRYVESIQVADIALGMWRRHRLDEDPRSAALDLGFIGEYDLTGDADGSSPQSNP